MKKLIFLYLLVLICNLVYSPKVEADNTTYYVDSAAGNDANNGITPDSAWKSLDKINNMSFQPGDRILLKAGSVWSNSRLYLKGNGRSGSPIIVDKYGTGERPIINCNGAYSEGILLRYNEYWEINNLEVTNYDTEVGRYRRGVYIETGDTLGLEHIYLRNLYVHDVNGDLSDRCNGGIIFRSYSTYRAVNFSDVLVEGCTVRNVDRDGIRFSGEATRDSDGIVIRNNFVDNIGGDGIVNVGTKNALVEYNVAKDCNMRGDKACVAIWPFKSDDTILQYNEAYLTRNTKDGQGFDADYNCNGTIIQYNYSHDNVGGFVLICCKGDNTANFNTGSIIRYNISQNDKERAIMLSGNANNTQIYNNTIYIASHLSTNVIDSWDWYGWASNTSFTNNIFYNLGSGGYDFGQTTGNVFDYNVFYGNHNSFPFVDSHRINNDPMFVNPGGASIGRDTASAYKLQGNSPCIDSGTNISNNGGKDYFGNSVPINGKVDRGAHEYKYEYLLSFDNVELTDGNSIIQSVKNVTKIRANVTIAGLEKVSPKKPKLILALYNDENKVVGISMSEVSQANSSIVMDGIIPGQASYLKLYLWESVINMKPYAEFVKK